MCTWHLVPSSSPVSSGIWSGVQRPLPGTQALVQLWLPVPQRGSQLTRQGSRVQGAVAGLWKGQRQPPPLSLPLRSHAEFGSLFSIQPATMLGTLSTLLHLLFLFLIHYFFSLFLQFLKNFYCYSITVVCLFSPSLHPTPLHLLLFNPHHLPMQHE